MGYGPAVDRTLRLARGEWSAAGRRHPIQAKIFLTERVRGVFDDLLGKAAWSPPKDWGRAIVTFPGPGAWQVPTRFWHWDNPGELHLDRPRGLFVVSFIGPVAPRSGGTLILSGSPRLLIQQERDPVASPWDRFGRSHPWLMALMGQAPSPADRIAAFMGRETIVEGVPLRVVELTGKPGEWFLPSPHRPLRRSEPRRATALHADQEGVPYPRGSSAAPHVETSALVDPGGQVATRRRGRSGR